MEFLLSIVIIILLIIQNSRSAKERLHLKNELNKLHEKLNQLLTVSKEEEKTLEKDIEAEDAEESSSAAPEITLETPPIKVSEPIKIEDEKIDEKEAEEDVQEPVEPIKVVSFSKSAAQAMPVDMQEKSPRIGLWQRFKQRNPDLEKFIGENLINKIGILILVLGISYFVKYAIDKDWINEPARVGIGILAGSLVLFIAHRLRKKYAPFSSVLVAGAIAVFYFTIAIAYHEYQLFGQQVAFAIMVVITAFSCLISLSYNRMELAILSLIGGFLVPFMISSGSGNYLVLFTYIAILDIGILTLAYFKKWHVLQILAFVFTTLLFGAWVFNNVYLESPNHIGALVFGFVFYIIFVMTTIINNLRTKARFSKVQLVMLSLNNFVFYGVGMLVLSEFKPNLSGLFTVFLALLNLGYALFLYKKYGLDKIAVYLLIGLTLTFITLAIPVQFSGNNITIFWAVEAVLLMWLAQKSKIKSYRFAAVIVQFLMLISLLMDWPSYVFKQAPLTVVFNPIFIGGVFVVASFVSVGLLLRHETDKLTKFGLTFNPKIYRKLSTVLAVITGYFVGFAEVAYQANAYFSFVEFLAVFMVYHLVFTAVLCFVLDRYKSTLNHLIINIFAVFNILVFTYVSFNLPRFQFQDYVLDNVGNTLAYYLHLLSFMLVVYFWYLLYKINKRAPNYGVFQNKFSIWFAVFTVVYALSNEVILQGLHIMSFSVNPDEFVSSYDAVIDLTYPAKYKIIKTGLPILWGVLAFVLLILGIKKQVKQLRIIALTLLGLTIVKLFVYDISNVSETGKIIAFILLGVLVLIISFVYQKIKTLVIDEDKKNEHDKTN